MDYHEYAVVGHSRAVIGRQLGLLATALTTAITWLLLAILAFLKTEGITAPIAVAVPPLGGMIFAGVYFAFDKKMWRWKWVRTMMNIPDIEGTWRCTGKRLDAGEGESNWTSEITIQQTWEKIYISQRSAQGSTSFSRAASLLRHPDGSFLLMYSYENEPDIAKQTAMNSHIGYCELAFEKDSMHANGYYFNNKGRVTHGSMELEKI